MDEEPCPGPDEHLPSLALYFLARELVYDEPESFSNVSATLTVDLNSLFGHTLAKGSYSREPIQFVITDDMGNQVSYGAYEPPEIYVERFGTTKVTVRIRPDGKPLPKE